MNTILRILTLYGFLLLPLWGVAEDEPLPSALQTELQAQLEALPQKLADLEQRDHITSVQLEQAELDARNARLQVQNLRAEVNAARRDAEEKAAGLAALTQQIEALRKEPVTGGQEELAAQRLAALMLAQEQVQAQKKQFEDNLEQTMQRYHAARIALVVSEDWFKRLQPIYQQQQSQTLESQTQIEQQQYLERAAKLRQQLEKFADAVRAEDLWQRRLLETQLFDAEERAAIAPRSARLIQTEIQLQRLNSLLEEHRKADIDATHVAETDLIAQEMKATINLLQQKVEVLEKRLAVLVRRSAEENLARQAHKLNQEEQNLIEALLHLRRGLLLQAQTLADSARHSGRALSMAYEENQQRALYSRRNLPITPEGWHILFKEVALMPDIFLQQLQSTLRTAQADLHHVSSGKWMTALVLILLLYAVLSWGRHHLQNRRHHLEKVHQAESAHQYSNSFLYYSINTLLRLAEKNIGGLLFTAILLVLIWVIQPAASTAFLVLALSVLWLTIKLPVSFAWLLLAAPEVPKNDANHKLYVQLRGVLILFGILAALTLLVHLMPFSNAIRELNDSLFMLFLLLAVVPALHIRNLGLARLQKNLPDSRWLWLLRLLTLLLPLAILAVSLLGVFGFIHLGWALARQLSWLLLVLTLWLVLRGLLNDTVAFLKNFALRHSTHYGLLWTQDIIPLLQRLSQLLLALGAALLLLRLNGWDAVNTFDSVIHYTLFSIGESHITLGNFGLSLFALYAVFWFGGWVKQITYRWIYSNINDLGARHSLSTFTQYAVVIIGGIIAMRILGLDLTTFTVFAGALGVGLGFGLQNIANNFVSGLLLLAERPLRTGDLVNIGGTYEGEVKEIGVRSLTIKTWDSQEVIVPNSQLISNPFTNWTHSDSTLRTVLLIGVSYHSDLLQVKRILEEVIVSNPKVLTDPEPIVLLNEFADSAVIFRVHYYFNVREISLIKLKSEILLEIWQRFKSANIEIPYPQRDIHIKTANANVDVRTP
jgi:potassium-dependent mechanosensitive channel